MAATRILEDLITILALRNYIVEIDEYLKQITDSTDADQVGILPDFLSIAQSAFNRRVKNLPDYEQQIAQYIHSNEGRPESLEGDDKSTSTSPEMPSYGQDG